MLEVSLLDSQKSDFDFVLFIKSNVKIDENKLFFEAASPPDRITSFTSSALPFFNKSQAFYESPNVNHISLNDKNEGIINLYYPNSYYEELGNYLVKPNVKLIFYINAEEHTMNIKLADNISGRTLFSDNENNVKCKNDTLVDSQENILKRKKFSL